ncbi:MAG: hypothetical protein PWR19_1988 [Carnobacterium sp.]|uniref:glycosyltransferase family 2 protein n=1 Tax=Carnobacterium sp. TaxID=48221 RepID=UPI002647ABF7|nr:glycosyltransferase family 2 protein [Carnobacterium sp.]MDN5372942.1 hypothetical protein [Carnobacterium sp.]
MENLVSIIIPIYNTADYLDKMIDSILNQTYQNIEVILIDDGSTDESLKKCLQYKIRDKRIKVFNQANSGVSVARNRGIQESNGEFLFFFDGDDYVEQNIVEIMLKNLTRDIDMVVCGITIHNHYLTNQESHRGIAEKEKTISMENLAFNYWEYYELGVINSPCNKLFRKSIIDQYQLEFPEGIKMGEDAYFNLSYFSHSRRIKILKDPLYHYFIYSGQSSKKINTDHYQMMVFNFEKIKSFIQQFRGFENKKTLAEYYYQIYREALYSMKLIYRSDEYTKKEKKSYISEILGKNQDIQKANPQKIEDHYYLPLFKRKSIHTLHFIIQFTELLKMGIKKIVLK